MICTVIQCQVVHADRLTIFSYSVRSRRFEYRISTCTTQFTSLYHLNTKYIKSPRYITEFPQTVTDIHYSYCSSQMQSVDVQCQILVYPYAHYRSFVYLPVTFQQSHIAVKHDILSTIFANKSKTNVTRPTLWCRTICTGEMWRASLCT